MGDTDVGETNPPRGKEKRFGCGYCDRLFARKEHADRHERTHTQEKPFSCPQCSSRFTRSDLLVRHERLTHKKENGDSNEGLDQSLPRKRKRVASTATTFDDVNSELASPPEAAVSFQPQATEQPGLTTPTAYQDMPFAAANSDHDFLTTLSFAAEHAALQDSLASPADNMSGNMSGNMRNMMAAPSPQFGQHRTDQASFGYDLSAPQAPFTVPAPAAQMSIDQPQLQDVAMTDHIPDLGFEDGLDSLAAFLDNGTLSSYHFSSVISAEQPVPFFSPESLSFLGDTIPNSGNPMSHPPAMQSLTKDEEQSSFSRFGSRLPSLQPEERPAPNPVAKQASRPLADVSLADRQTVVEKFEAFTSTVSPDFKLPSRLALSRYLAAYISGFHEHLPFLHLPTTTIETCSIELILAMAAVGAQYCFEGERGVELFHASQAIAAKRIRRRDAALPTSKYGSHRASSTCSRGSVSHSGFIGEPSYAGTPENDTSDKEDLMQTAQALLVLMAMATWAKHKEILREALAIQSILATIVREDGLKFLQLSRNASWEEWVRMETVKRTKFIIFCFFNLHCIVYNIPPLILNSELKMILPSSAAEFKAPDATQWRAARSKAVSPTTFEDALSRLFSRGGRSITEWNSSLGNYILIHALIQHIFFVRQMAKCRYNGNGELLPEDMSALELALRNWQVGWRRNPESSLDPLDPNGPVAFNSTALLRLAYIRLNVDTGPGRALDTRDPFQIANAFRESPAIKRTPKLVRAVLHSAHALSIPVKIGVRLVAQTQMFIWSIQHSLCSLECAFLLSKWLDALSAPHPDPLPSEDEKRIVALVKIMLDETEFALPPGIEAESPSGYKHLSAGVLRVWATVFCGSQTWAIVDVIGMSLNVYATMLESELPTTEA